MISALTSLSGPRNLPRNAVDTPGVYLTDEVFLYRVVSRVGSGEDEMLELEDCYGLDIVRVRAADLGVRALRAVMPKFLD